MLALLALVGLRVAVPVAVSRRHRLHVRRVVAEAPGVVSLEVGGVALDRLGAEAGQFFHWRFLAPGLWRESHPFSLSEAPDGRRLRVTVKGSGDFTGRVAAVRPGTRVLVEGPCGELTAAARRRPRVALIAGGVGIAPLRALLQDLEGAPGEITLIYRAGAAGDVLFGGELDALARERGVEVHYLLGDGADLLTAAELRRLVPDIAARDVFVCGPPRMTAAVSAGLRRAGSRAAHHQRGLRVSPGRRAVPALVAAAAVAGLLAAVRPRPATPRAPTGALQLPVPAGPGTSAEGEPRRVSTRRPSAAARGGRVRRATGPAVATPFSNIQVAVTLTGHELDARRDRRAERRRRAHPGAQRAGRADPAPRGAARRRAPASTS